MPPFSNKNAKLKIVEYGKDAVQIRSFDSFKKKLTAYLMKKKETKKQ